MEMINTAYQQIITEYASPYQVSLAMSISRDRLTNLIKLGLIKAKRLDQHAVLIQLDSVRRYIESLPDIEPDQGSAAE